MWQILGQVFSFVAVLFAAISYQMKTHRQVLAMHTMVVVSIAVSYAMLGAWPGAVLNIVSILRNLVFYFDKTFRWKCWPWVMTGVMALAGVLTWNGPWSLLVIAGLVINSFFLSDPNPQHLRISLLLTCPLVLVYDVVVMSLGGVLLEGMSMVSAAIGLVRFRKQKNG